MDTTIVTLTIGLLTILSNIGITIYNAGKNRKIYEIKPFHVGPGKGTLDDINEALNQGDYTILHIGQNLKDTRTVDYILGRLREKNILRIILKKCGFRHKE